MNDSTPSKMLPISHDLEVRPPVTEQGFTVSDSDWSYLKKKISQISTGQIGYHTAGSVSLGIAGSAFVALLTLPQDVLLYGIKSSFLCWGIVLVFGICGIMAFVFSQKQRSFTIRAKDDAIEEMDRIEKRCNPLVSNHNK